MSKSLIRSVWALLSNVTPLKQDCGTLCSAACCAPDEDGQGSIYLFPGEKELLESADWALIGQDSFGNVLTCQESCEREMRPLGCRIFPLTPRRKKDGTLMLKIDRRAFAMCPLAPSGIGGLDPAFVQAALTALRILDSNEEGRAFLDRWIALERQFAEATL